MLEKDLPEPERLLVRLRITRRKIVLVVLDGRQAARLRRVLEQKPGDDGDERSDERVEVELRTPVVEQQDADEREIRDQRAADVVRDVPRRDGESALFRAEPVHHRLAARRPAHALDPAVDRLDYDDRDERRVCSIEQAEGGHDPLGKQQAERQEVLRVAAVRDRAHQELETPYAIDSPVSAVPSAAFVYSGCSRSRSGIASARLLRTR